MLKFGVEIFYTLFVEVNPYFKRLRPRLASIPGHSIHTDILGAAHKNQPAVALQDVEAWQRGIYEVLYRQLVEDALHLGVDIFYRPKTGPEVLLITRT